MKVEIMDDDLYFGVLTCGVMPWWQAYCLLQETKFWVVQSESLVHNVGCWLHIHLADGHWFAIACPECYL